MVQFVYIDETGSVGKGAAKQPYLTLAAVLVQEDKVQPLSRGLRDIASVQFDCLPDNFEFHGYEMWNKSSYWAERNPPEIIAAYEAAIELLEVHGLSVAHSSINKGKLHARCGGIADGNSYRLALQFLLEKIDVCGGENKIIVADEAKEEQLGAIKMVADMQDWGGGEVPGKRLRTVIDSLHYVQSHASPGVQMADLVAYVLQRTRTPVEKHPDAIASMSRLREMVDNSTLTWREPWPK